MFRFDWMKSNSSECGETMPSKMDELYELVDHIEIDHERELSSPYTFSRLNPLHEEMHKREWDHSHKEEQE